MTRLPKKVSVCLATYKGSAYVEEQLRSILAQLDDDAEVVVYDDASPDKTPDIVQAMDDQRIRLIRGQVNKGYVKAFEAALSSARGEFVFLSDQDDVWRPGRVAQMCNALASSAAVATNLATLNGPQSIRGPYGQNDWHLRAGQSKQNVLNVLGILAGNRPYYGCAMALRRDLLEVILPFPPFLKESHDLWIALCANLAGQMSHLEIRSLERRIHGDNQTTERPRGILPALKSRWMLLRCLVPAWQRIRHRDWRCT